MGAEDILYCPEYNHQRERHLLPPHEAFAADCAGSRGTGGGDGARRAPLPRRRRR